MEIWTEKYNATTFYIQETTGSKIMLNNKIVHVNIFMYFGVSLLYKGEKHKTKKRISVRSQ